MHLFINALAATNLSSRKVLRGWIRGFRELSDPAFRVSVLAPRAAHRLPKANVVVVGAPPATRHWLTRRIWEEARLSALVERLSADVVLHFSGIPVPDLPVPQIAYLHNPIPFLKDVPASAAERVKLRIQARAIRRFLPDAAALQFPSEYMRRLVVQAAPEARSIPAFVIPHGHDLAPGKICPLEARGRGRVVTVSNWAPHKNLEVVLHALSALDDVTLDVVGPWADARYRRKMERLVVTLGLGGRVSIHGFLPAAQLRRMVATARVFCLMSRSESFGLPALEAQALGTPVIVSTATAMPEVCGEGAITLRAGDPRALADAVQTLALDDMLWRVASGASIRNALDYRWTGAASHLQRLARTVLEADIRRPRIHLGLPVGT